MELVVESTPKGSDSLHPTTPSFQAEAEAQIMLTTFESELDALLDLLNEDRKKAVSEALIRRYVTAERIYKDMEEGVQRIELKMMMLSDKLGEGFSGRRVLESSGEPDQEASGG